MVPPELDALCDQAARMWPGIVVERSDLLTAIEAKGEPPTAEGVAELYLALAVARGDAKALAAFERDYLSVVPPALAGMKLPAATVEDVRATVRERLVLPHGEQPPRIVEYAGKGRLRGLIQVAASRAAIDRIRQDEKLTALPTNDALVASADVALSVMKAQYRQAFAAAFTRAVGAATPRDRNLLRLHFLEGVTLEALAQMYGVHRATVVRWLAAARDAVFTATRSELKLPDTELDELFAMVASRVELSLERLLASVEHSTR